MTKLPEQLKNRGALDFLGRDVAARLSAEENIKGRAKWVVPVILITGVIVLQEGYFTSNDLVNGAKGSHGAIDQLPETAKPFLALAAIGALMVMAPRVYQRTKARIEELGLEDA